MTGAARAFALLFVALHILALFAFTLRWLWVAMLAVALLIHAAKAEELIEPTPQEYADIQKWIPQACCWTNNCCRKVRPSALIPLSRDDYLVAATRQPIKRTGWSQDGNTWRCTCDPVGSKWVVSVKANTRCIFPVPNGY